MARMRSYEMAWKTAPISKTCETIEAQGVQCGRPTTCAYAAMGGGWMALCEHHGEKHRSIATPIGDLLASGEALTPND